MHRQCETETCRRGSPHLIIVIAVQELFSTQELQEKFSLERITKSAAVFDKTKLSWMNGQYLRALPDEEVMNLLLLQAYSAGCCAYV